MDRIAALSGLAAPIAILAGVSLAEVEADPTQPSAIIAQALARNREQTRLGAQLSLLGAFLIPWFTSYLYARIRRAEAAVGWPSALVLAEGRPILMSMKELASAPVADASPAVATRRPGRGTLAVLDRDVRAADKVSRMVVIYLDQATRATPSASGMD